ncbi:unnamed protein product [Oikopleura dioica]|uniref:Nucleolar protein 56 n=1 Tax=Oikopleura dioica TaxID=34765 RepID=E4WZY1_OIKDI|nr:unnamed protein product [Oikopleura dioica]
MFVLYEHASGYVLVHCEQTDDISELNANDYASFGQLVKLKAFQPFTSAAIALDNMNAVSEGLVHADLKKFLVNNVPKGQSVGINDQRLLQVVKEELDMSVAGGDIVLEICRGVRMHVHQMIKPLTLAKEGGAQLGLSHSYSRTKVKFNVNRMDNMVIQAIALIDQLDKDINTFAMRVREWYGYHFPEMVRLVNDNYQYCQLIGLIKMRKNLTAPSDELLEAMEKVVMDSAKTQAICDCARASMGMDISEFDLINIEIFAKKVISLADYRKKLQQYLSDKMSNVAPSLAALIGDVVGARLISHAGSLTKLAKYPASTVQILGAEKALFRALKTKGNTPKYGLLFHSTFIGRATAKNKGRISRFLANKCSIASRIDAFSETPNNIFGDKLKEQVEERLKMYEDGDVPRKNIDVMKEAMQAVKAAQPEDEQTVAPTKRKIEAVDEADTSETPSKKKKKKKDKVKEEPSEEASEEVTEETPKKKKKKKKAKEEASEEAETVTEEASVEPETDSTEVKKKKKKKKAKEEPSEEAEPVTEETSQEVDSSEKKKKKKKKKKAEEE